MDAKDAFWPKADKLAPGSIKVWREAASAGLHWSVCPIVQPWLRLRMRLAGLPQRAIAGPSKPRTPSPENSMKLGVFGAKGPASSSPTAGLLDLSDAA
ncbi:hypothetical protein FQN51_001581 [Onygenales sp. PD_10]|nr:hypothetical protein FQN51_001581 [Onygenales sp. PD_10]